MTSPESTNSLRAGMVGMGMIFDETYRPFFERTHREGLYDRRFGDVSVPLVAVATRTGTRAEAYKKAAGAAIHPFVSHAGADSVAKMLAAGVDFVCVASPDDRHFGAAKAALEAGAHVLIEKPSVLRLQELDELVELAHSKNRLAKVVYHKLLDPDHKKLRTLVHDQVLSPQGRGEGTRSAATKSLADFQPSTLHYQPSFTPSLIINVSGAWGDITLNGIDAGTTPLFAGTKGSHFITRHPQLKAALGDGGVYAETADRRLCFILPLGDAVLVGTTDERWSGPPEDAVASDAELDYLLSLVQTVFGLTLSRLDIVAHYSGVRPLPRTTDTNNAAVSRDHSLVEHRLHGVHIVTLVGAN